jgi:hypothetical protein
MRSENKTMRTAAWMSLICPGALLLAQPLAAAMVPTRVEAPGAEQAFTAYFPFDPPLETPLRYRVEETARDGGETEMSWSVFEVTFSETADGYSMTVEETDGGGDLGEDLPEAMAIVMDELGEELKDKPIVLNLSAEGEILSLQDSDFFWSRLSDALETAVAAQMAESADPVTAEQRERVKVFLESFRNLPDETRLAMLLETIQPIVEWAGIELSSDDPISTQVESGTMFGDTITKQVHVTLEAADAYSGSVQVHTSVPKEELMRLTTAIAGRLAPVDGEQTPGELEAIDEFSLDEIATYRVSQEDGLLLRYQYEKRARITGGEEASDEQESMKLERIE